MTRLVGGDPREQLRQLRQSTTAVVVTGTGTVHGQFTTTMKIKGIKGGDVDTSNVM